MEPAVAALVQGVEQKLEDLEKLLRESSQQSWEMVSVPLEEISREINSVWGPVGHLIGVKNTSELREAFQKAQPKIIELGLRISQSLPIFQALKSLRQSPDWDQLSPAQQRAIDLELKSARVSGIELEGEARKRFNAIVQRLSELKTEFSNHVLDATKSFQLEIQDPQDVAGMPKSFLNLASQTWNQSHPELPPGTPEKGPWTVTLDYPSYLPFLQHCPNSELRKTAYMAAITRASHGKWDNSGLIKEILKLRQEKAELLGFSCYAEVSLYQKMAHDTDEIMGLLKELLQAAKPPALEEDRELEKMAEQLGAPLPLQKWDTYFYAERMREKLFGYTDDDLRPYFPLPKVLKGLFALVEKLFGVLVQEKTGEAEVWHPDVKYFEIHDASGPLLASFYLDPYSRPEDKRGGAWMNTCIDRGYYQKKFFHPVAYLVCNGTPPVGDQPSLLTFREVETLFHEFGHGLQHMLTEVDVAGVAGINGVDWDAVELPSQFMENWCYHKPTLLGLTGHVDDDRPLPDELFEKIKQAKNFRSANQMLRQLHFSMIDLKLHSDYDFKTDPAALNIELSKEILTQPLLPEDRFLCSFSHIFAGGYAAGYYSYKWAEVLSADAFSAFEEAGLDQEEKVRDTGHRFRKTVLALGGSQPPSEVFQAFRGRKHQVAPLLRHSGLKV